MSLINSLNNCLYPLFLPPHFLWMKIILTITNSIAVTLVPMQRASLVGQRLMHLPAMWETWVQSLGREDPLEKEMATHSSILAWRIPWMEEPGGLQSTGSQRVRHDWATSLSISTPQTFLLSPISSDFPSPRPSDWRFSWACLVLSFVSSLETGNVWF